MNVLPSLESSPTTEPSLRGSSGHVDLFSACPASLGELGPAYVDRVRAVARWSEDHGFRGILVYSDNRLVDPWMVAQLIVQSTRRLSPLVAVQPAYMHPYAVATKVATLASLYGRRTFINWVAGGFRNDLVALADRTPHDPRYDRLTEYATLVRRLTDGETVTFDGEYYEVNGLSLQPEVPADLRPAYTLSGSSPAGERAARALGATAVTYALPPESDLRPIGNGRLRGGLRMGIIARADRAEAWRVAYRRFPPEREGALMRGLARRVSDSHWHEHLCALAEERSGEDSPFWMGPFEHYRTMCPYLVGSHADVASTLAVYLRRGFRDFILDEPWEEQDLVGARLAFDAARAAAEMAA